jgi:AraC family transcriptional regulator
VARFSRVEASYISSKARALTCGKEGEYIYGRAIYPPGGRCGPRIQSDYQLIVLIGGSLRLTIDQVNHDLAPGKALLLHPGANESFNFSPDAESVHTWCQVSPDLLSPADRRLIKRARTVCQAPSSVHLLIEEGLAVPDQGNANLHKAMAALARACLLRFAAYAGALDTRNAVPIHPALQRAFDVAAGHYAELHTGEELARRVGVSASQLRALFRDARGESPSAMIWRIKVEHAIQLIRSTGLTLGEIANNCGYANAFHLSRAVRRHTGHPPRRLRQIEWGR